MEAHPARTSAGRSVDPHKMADSTVQHSKGKEETKKWPRMVGGEAPSSSPHLHLSSTQHSFPKFPSQKTLQNTCHYGMEDCLSIQVSQC